MAYTGNTNKTSGIVLESPHDTQGNHDMRRCLPADSTAGRKVIAQGLVICGEQNG